MFINFAKKSLAFVLLLVLSPLFLVMFIAVKASSKGPAIFRQKRAGKDKKPFVFYKVRTMVVGAEKLKKGLIRLNEADGPVFKIRHDPRYTKLGKFLSHTGLDELPQLVNIMKGEMDFVGPRPLPVEESEKVPKKYHLRYSVLPGMTSPWIVKGSHKMNFSDWMRLDVEYAKNKNVFYDVRVFAETAFVIITLIIKKLLGKDDEKHYSRNRRV